MQEENKTALLSTLAQSSNKWVQLATVGLVAMSGFGNWVATNNNASETRIQVNAARDQAYRNLKDMHDALEDFEKRQKAVLDGLQLSAKNQQQMIDNQTRILSEIRQAHQ